MHLRRITACILRVPLRKPFRHASAVRHYSDNIVVEAELADGTLGWGEGVPREYVTGETAEGGLAQLGQTDLATQLAGDAASWPEVFDLCQRFAPAPLAEDPRDCQANALRSAVELSLLDAYGKLFGEPVRVGLAQFAAVEPVLYARDTVRYSTTIDAEHGRKLRRSAIKMRLYGFQQCKVKVGSDADADRTRLALVRRWMGPRVDLRVDANEAWRAENMAAHARALAPSDITCIEQPLPHEQLEALCELRLQIDVPVMLDESLTSLRDAQRAVELGACDYFNIRISKCGGLLRSLQLAAYAQQHGLGYQLGCHPGETGILSAAGRHFATSVGGIRYLEGSYDRHVLAQLPTSPDLTFGYGGRARQLQRPGLGATLNPARAKKMLRDQVQFEVEG